MRRGRKRGRRGTWFPLVGTIFGDTYADSTWFDFSGEWSGDSPKGRPADFGTANPVFATTLTQDDTPDIDNPDTGSSLRDFVEGQEYLLERIVGKVNVGMWHTDGPVVSCIAAAGICVMPVQDSAQATPALSPADYDPLVARNAQNPWVWRRTWNLTNTFAGTLNSPSYPNTNAEYGSVLDGPHIDTRGSKRRIRREQRLFFVASAQVLDSSGSTTETPSIVSFTVDVRVFGAMRRGTNTSTFK